MALDQGTTSSRTILFDQDGTVLASANEPFDCLFPQSGWVEQNPEVVWKSQFDTIQAALSQANLKMADITAIGITNQRETVVAWDKTTGEAIGNAIVWQCRRTADFCESLKAEGFDQVISEKTGLVTNAYFSGTKMKWILDNVEGAQILANQGKLAFGTMDSWLIWKLTQGQSHVMDASNASRTMVYDIFAGRWDETILNRLSIPQETLPDVKDSSGIVAHTSADLLGASVPIAGIAGDQQASLFGQACFDKGMAKNTYGTGCFMLLNTGAQPIRSQHNLLTTVAWQKGGEVTYALEGSVFVGGALIQWLRDEMEFFKDARETEAMAQAVEDTNGVYVVPAFVGLGAPHWDSYARGTIVGLTRGTSKNHLVRASLEAIAYQVYEILKCMESDNQSPLQSLRVDGNASANNFLCQFQADLLGLKVKRPENLETTAMGAAFLAGLATDVWKDEAAIQSMWHESREFKPEQEASQVKSLLEGWHRAIGQTRFRG